MREFLSPHNVSFYWEDRLKEEDGYTLYVSDCFWVLATKDFMSFTTIRFIQWERFV